MRYKYVAVRKDMSKMPGLELLKALDGELFQILTEIFGNERILRSLNSRLFGIENRQKQLLKLYELVLENLYRIKGDQTQVHKILSKIEDLLLEEGINIVSLNTDGLLTIYFYDTNNNSFFIMTPQIEEDLLREGVLDSLRQITDRFIIRTFGDLSPEQHNYIKTCIEFITTNYFSSGFLAGKAMREGWNYLIQALQHLNEPLGNRSFWNYISQLQERNILFIPFFQIDFSSDVGLINLTKTMEALLTGINIIPTEILYKSNTIPLLVSSVLASAGAVLGKEGDIVVINYEDINPDNFPRNPRLMQFKATNILIHEIVGHHLFYLLIKQGQINETQLRELLAAAKVSKVEYIYNGKIKETDIDEWFKDFKGNLNELIHSLVSFDSFKETAKYLSSFHERVAFACGDTERDIKVRSEFIDLGIRKELAMQRDIIRTLTAIGLLTFKRDGRRFSWNPFDYSITELP